MNEKDISLIRESFSRIAASDIDYACVFYDTLFESTPSAAALFSDDMESQKKKLRATIALVVKGLDRFDTLKETVFELGKRHVGYGVHPDDFPDVADALLKTFYSVLNDFSTKEANAWRKGINTISGVMLEAWKV